MDQVWNQVQFHLARIHGHDPERSRGHRGRAKDLGREKSDGENGHPRRADGSLCFFALEQCYLH